MPITVARADIRQSVVMEFHPRRMSDNTPQSKRGLGSGGAREVPNPEVAGARFCSFALQLEAPIQRRSGCCTFTKVSLGTVQSYFGLCSSVARTTERLLCARNRTRSWSQLGSRPIILETMGLKQTISQSRRCVAVRIIFAKRRRGFPFYRTALSPKNFELSLLAVTPEPDIELSPP